MDRTHAVNRIIDQVRLNPSVRLDLTSAAAIAGYGPHHFHRVFLATTGETLQQFSSRVRLAYAARLLRLGWSPSLLELALSCGFNSAEDFSRRFRARFECTPREAQRGARICVNPARLLRKDRIDRLRKLSCHPFIRGLRVQELPAFDVVYGRVFGAMQDHAAVLQMIQAVYSWAIRTHNVGFNQRLQMVGIGWDDADASPADRFMYDAGIVLEPNCTALAREPWMNHVRVPARTYVVMDFEGDLADEEDAFDYVHHAWLAKNGCTPATGPSFEVFSDERSLEDWNNLKLKLMVPVSC